MPVNLRKTLPAADVLLQSYIWLMITLIGSGTEHFQEQNCSISSFTEILHLAKKKNGFFPFEGINLEALNYSAELPIVLSMLFIGLSALHPIVKCQHNMTSANCQNPSQKPMLNPVVKSG